MHTGGGRNAGMPGYPDHLHPSNLYMLEGRRTHIGSFNVLPYIQHLAAQPNGIDIAEWAIVRSFANHPGYMMFYTPDTSENTFLRPTLEIVFYGEGPPSGTPPTEDCYGQVTLNLGGGTTHDFIFDVDDYMLTTHTVEFTTGATVNPASVEISTSSLVGRFEVSHVSLVDITPTSAELTLNIAPSVTFQTMEGFGFFGARAVWWNPVPFDPNRSLPLYAGGAPMTDTEWIDFILLDLGITMWRNEIYPFLPVYSMQATNTQDTHWDQQKYFVKALNDRAVELGIDLRVILTVWSPPGEWKFNQHTRSDLHGPSPDPPAGTHRNDWNRLMPEHYVDFAYWLVSSLELYREIGVDIYAISPQNEPYFHQFFNSSFYTAAQFVDMLNTVAPIIYDYFPDVYVFGAEGMLGHEQSQILGWTNPNMQYHRHILGQMGSNPAIPEAMRNFVFAVHGYYDGVYAQAVEMHANLWAAERAMLGSDHRSWMTETSGYSNNWMGAGIGRPGSLALGKAIQSALVYGDVSAWVWWQGSDIVASPDGAYYELMRPGVNQNKIAVSQHFYRYIRPGAVRVGAELSAPSDDLIVSAFQHDDMDNDVIVLINFGSTEYTLGINGLTGTFESVITTGSPNYLVPGPTVVAGDPESTIVVPPYSIITLVRGEYREPYTPASPAMSPAQMAQRDVDLAISALEGVSARETTFVTTALLAYNQAAALAVAQDFVGRWAFYLDWEILDTPIVFTPAVNASPGVTSAEGSLTFQVRVTQGAFTDTTGTLTLRILPIEEAEGSLTLNFAQTYQTLEGLGIMGGIGVWGQNASPADYYSQAWVEAVVDYLGVSMWRTTMSGNDPVRDANPVTGNMTHGAFGGNVPIPQTNWDMQRPTVEALAAQSEDVRVIITVNSPPANMKVETTDYGTVIGGTATRFTTPHNNLRGGTLDPTRYACFAAWLIEGIQMYKDAGALVYGISLTNEPLFTHPHYEYALFTPAWYVEMINNVVPLVHAAFPDVKFFGAQSLHLFETAPWSNVRYTSAMISDTAAHGLMSAFAYHFDGSAQIAATLNETVSAMETYRDYVRNRGSNTPIWLTQAGGGNRIINQWASTDTRAGALVTALDLQSALRYGDASAWVTYYTNTWLTADANGEVQTGKVFYALRQFYRFLRPGAVRFSAEHDIAESNMMITGWRHAELENTVVVIVNPDDAIYALNLLGAGLPEYFEMFITTAAAGDDTRLVGVVSDSVIIPASSVVTLVYGDVDMPVDEECDCPSCDCTDCDCDEGPVTAMFSLHAFNNGVINNQSLANGGTIRIWTRLDGANALVPFAGLNVTAVLPNGESAMHLVRVNQPWANPGYVNFIDVNFDAPWHRIYFTATVFGQTVELVLINPRPPVVPEFSLNVFNNGVINNQSLANAGLIRLWTRLDGVNANVLITEITAVDQDGNNAMEHLRRINTVGVSPQNGFDVNFNAPWQRIYLTVTAYGQTLELVLVNPRPVPEFSLNVFNNGVINNQSLANAGLIRLWTRLDGVNANVLITEITAVDQDGNDAMEHLRRVNTVGVSPQNGFDVNFNAPWQRIYLTVTAYGQTLELTLVNPS